ncbi:hypothetical protein K488DRAFT_54795 [Vararia minispora EC-137]|uniref:Uncharacterized protein n=1 Tax=Vararia minispora EC-137 TaxID=1314806 RepID=A0ACB8QEI9_9AGAM|nr:hypothetical protein K488DRAFT_54795 [Vararia minispora EC-137]
MAPLTAFPLPLPPFGPPEGYAYEEYSASEQSRTTAFNTGIDQRDRFLGQPRCVVCGDQGNVLQHCHIIPASRQDKWEDLLERNWLPPKAKHSVQHEPRNGLLMCPNHHAHFDKYNFFLRYLPGVRKVVSVNFSGLPSLQRFHGKAIALDIEDQRAPFPALFIFQEHYVRAEHLFVPHVHDVPDDPPWQDWILNDGVLRSDGKFERARPPLPSAAPNLGISTEVQESIQRTQRITATNAGGTSRPGYTTLVMNEDVVAEILAATRALPTWKACMLEGTSWTGTAEENTKKYLDIVGAGADDRE